MPVNNNEDTCRQEGINQPSNNERKSMSKPKRDDRV